MRFDVNDPLESAEDFVKRINKKKRDEDGEPYDSPSRGKHADRWLLGDYAKIHGSIHSDLWVGASAVDVAACKYVAVYPVGGWWKNRHWLNRCSAKVRYSLVVSITTEAEEVDIYTSVANQLKVPVEIDGRSRGPRSP